MFNAVIAIVYSLPSKRSLMTEYGITDEDSAVIALMVSKGLEARGMKTKIYPISEDNIESITNIKADCIFNLIEWCGQDIQLSQRAFYYLRKLKLPVTGANELLFVLTGDKIQVKRKLKKLEVPTPNWLEFISGKETITESLNYPLIVKPSLEHCSMGLSNEVIVKNLVDLKKIVKKQLTKFKQPVLAEEFIIGRELLVYLIEIENTVKLLPITEILFENENPLAFQTYECKWIEGHPDYNSTYTTDAVLTDVELNAIQTICIKVFKQLGLRGYARFDLRLRNTVPYILETNANPSVYDATEELKDVNEEIITGIKFPDYLVAIVNSAIFHYKKGDRI